MRVLLLGAGGREHALAWKLAQSPALTALYAAPGNAGIARLAQLVALDPEDPATVTRFAQEHHIDLVVIGPEAPLAAGVADALRAAQIPTFGPSKAAARLEASKAFTKEICDAVGAPTAAWVRCADADSAHAAIDRMGAPIVVKWDGLAAGKGVVVATTVEEAHDAVAMMFAGSFGDSSAGVVIEEFMTGEEASLFVLTDGVDVLALPGAQDHKRAYDGDRGPNTGGMGAYSPAPVLSAEVVDKAMTRIIRPCLAEMRRRGIPYSGVLYAGLMIKDGEPRLVEFNARFGDPEAQVLMLRLDSDLLPLLHGCATGRLAAQHPRWSSDVALTVVMAARGYPGSYARGEVITGLDHAAECEGVVVFHAGTRTGPNDSVLSNGGRVLNVSARGATVAEARDRAYAAIERINWPGGFYRRDIAHRALSPRATEG